VVLNVRRARKKRSRERQEEIEKYGSIVGPTKFESDFDDGLYNAKNDFKRVEVDQTFGNDKIITSKTFRPSYGMAKGEVTKVLQIPIRSIESIIRAINGEGENKKKFDFFNEFPWYQNLLYSH